METLERAIEEKDHATIKEELIRVLKENPRDQGGEVTRALQDVDRSGIDVWEAHDGDDLDVNFGTDGFELLLRGLNRNFSRDRYSRAMEIGDLAFKDQEEFDANNTYVKEGTIRGTLQIVGFMIVLMLFYYFVLMKR